ncbi:2-oxo-4-hydroxy-4-carboxy-5-ureidoimidazoline decarboxylase [Streptomyces bathyalis]|uniref:2-oxo-4-hydroxy-4-carboxy-5-ureidoimidazoline decarboxylase n=1 Tax=Streptomyces bathyalis TaxID=2710756 RepID=A0A7T1TCU1_9ACTN|nr:2-oxo-4-hydroxy-4-carboxy-5-ureidoimidazoline decarboxylase [Streptomyces bathyalis]
MPLSRFNAAPDEMATAMLLRCCGSTRWAARIAACRPYPEPGSLLAALDEASYDMTPADIAEALASEAPQLPAPDDGVARSGPGRGPRGHDRPGLLAAHTALRAAHAAYENRFGHAFLVCLEEWGPDEWLDQALAAVRTRLGNDPEEERPVVAEELRRLARARLRRLVRVLPEAH